MESLGGDRGGQRSPPREEENGRVGSSGSEPRGHLWGEGCRHENCMCKGPEQRWSGRHQEKSPQDGRQTPSEKEREEADDSESGRELAHRRLHRPW